MTRGHRKSKRKTKRKTKRKNALKNFTTFYQNIREIKSMVDSLTKTLDDTNQTIICIVETDMLKEEEITIARYETVFRQDGTNNSDGMMIAVKCNIKTISM